MSLAGDERRYQVFVSSPWTGLQAERSAVMLTLLKLKCLPAGMELFPASSDEVWELIKQEIENADYYLMILAGIYGSVEPKSGLSFTEKEYDYAISIAKPVIAFLYRDIDDLPRDRREVDPSRLASLKSFHEKARGKSVKFWSNTQELELAVMQSCIDLFARKPAEGWVRARSTKLVALQSRLLSLEDELGRLKQGDPKTQGLIAISSGEGRDDAFRTLRARANARIIISGIGMSKISMYARRSLTKQAHLVPIHLLMIDPDFLEADRQFADRLQEFLYIRDFSAAVRASFNSLREFAQEWNANPSNTNKISLRVYKTIPTMSMVMIDPDSDNAELVIEFFLYQSGEHRPRLHIVKVAGGGLFSRIHGEFERLWAAARKIV